MTYLELSETCVSNIATECQLSHKCNYTDLIVMIELSIIQCGCS